MANSYPEVAIFHSQARTLVSSVVGQEFTISVWLPPDYAESQGTYPVLYLLDANVCFGIAADAIALLQMGAEIPQIIVVGVGYPIQFYDEWREVRARDLTPTVMADIPGSGGADSFLTFIRTELIPFIETSYRANPHDRALLGYSYGGLFVLYALFSQPGLFQRYVAGSPSIDWDGEFLAKLEAEYALHNRALPATLFISTGSLETDAADIEKAAAVLGARNYEGFHHQFVVLDGETHLSGTAPALVRGAKAIFASDNDR